ncbi:MAG: S9 family peptidase [Flavobacteriaceae bacterium]
MSKELIPAPRAQQIPHIHKKHNDLREDPYHWLTQRDQPAVLDYLTAENTYFQESTIEQEPLRTALFEEMKGRIKEDDQSVPYYYNGYWYIRKYNTGQQYPIYTRKKEHLEAEEELLFDCNKMAEGHAYFHLAGIQISPDNTKAVFALDLESRRKYTLYVKDLVSGDILNTKIDNTTGGSAWAADSKHLFYTHKNPETLRAESIYRHSIIGQTPDELIYTEEDETFSVYVSASKSDQYIFISSISTLTSEHQFLAADDPLGSFQFVQKRVQGLEYSVAHYQDHFFIMTNANGAENFKLVKTPIKTPSLDHWEDIIPHREAVLLEDLELFQDYFVLVERENGLTRIQVHPWKTDTPYSLPIQGETYTAYLGFNPQFDTQELRYVYNALHQPATVYSFHMGKQTQKQLKVQPVEDPNFNPDHYHTERLWVEARDGERIPMSVIYRKDTVLSSDTPFLLYAYGSYGATIDPSFSSTRLSLLDRGFVFGIAHVRGGEYLGRPWYEAGKLLQKKNTFFDFIDCSRYLIEKEYTSAEKLFASGGSAGGLLMGVVLNEAPELFKGVVAAVPFVDVVSTMLDDSIPLTTGEYDEWGNPNNEEYYHYIKSYSPYDNVRPQHYPHILVTAGYHDSQVQYWEPAKWVARLRLNQEGTSNIFLKTQMDAGHGGASGRFEALKEVAEQYAFLIALAV